MVRLDLNKITDLADLISRLFQITFGLPSFVTLKSSMKHVGSKEKDIESRLYDADDFFFIVWGFLGRSVEEPSSRNLQRVDER